MSEFGIDIDDKELRRVLDNAAKTVTDPEACMLQLYDTIQDGYTEQWDSLGRHWGDPWEPRGQQTLAIRRAQGDKNPQLTLYHTGATLRSLVEVGIDGYRGGMTVGFKDKHVVQLQEGRNDEFEATYKVKTKNVTVHYMGMPARQIQPVNGFNADELAEMTEKVKDFVENGLDI